MTVKSLIPSLVADLQKLHVLKTWAQVTFRFVSPHFEIDVETPRHWRFLSFVSAPGTTIACNKSLQAFQILWATGAKTRIKIRQALASNETVWRYEF